MKVKPPQGDVAMPSLPGRAGGRIIALACLCMLVGIRPHAPVTGQIEAGYRRRMANR